MKSSPDPSPEQQAKSIQEMFSSIAGRYDFLNRLLSLGIDTTWRKRCIRVLKKRLKASGPILDVAAGTGDLSLELKKKMDAAYPVIAADFSLEMLKILKRKMSPENRIAIVTADSLSLPFKPESFAGVTIGFGIRNFTDRPTALREIFHVLKPGGILAILEFSTPRNRFIRTGYLLYFEKILPFIGGIFSKRSAYTYLPESVRKFPEPEVFANLIHKAGFIKTTFSALTGGIAILYCAEKPVTDPSGKIR